MQRTCESCGRPYDAKRPQSRFCGDTCRKRAQREGNRGAEVSGETLEATRAALVDAGRAETWQGALAMTLARRVDETPGSGAGALGKELRATMAEALQGAGEVKSAIVLLREARDRKRDAG